MIRCDHLRYTSHPVENPEHSNIPRRPLLKRPWCWISDGASVSSGNSIFPTRNRPRSASRLAAPQGSARVDDVRARAIEILVRGRAKRSEKRMIRRTRNNDGISVVSGGPQLPVLLRSQQLSVASPSPTVSAVCPYPRQFQRHNAL